MSGTRERPPRAVAEEPAEATFDQEAVQRVLARAAELARTAPATAPKKVGLTLAELEAIARESGIDPAHVRAAAGELAVPAPSFGEKLLGGPARIVRERSLPGEADEARLAELADRARQVVGDPGRVELRPGSLTFTTIARTRPVLVTVLSRAGRTRVRVEIVLGPAIGGLFGGIGGGVGGGLGGTLAGVLGGALHMPLLGLAGMAGSMVFAFLLARTIFGGVARRDVELAERLAGELAQP